MIDSFASNEQNSFMIKQAVNFLKNNPVEIFIKKCLIFTRNFIWNLSGHACFSRG